MACDLETIVSGACDSGIGKETSPVVLLQIIAQSSAEYLLSIDPEADVSVDAILARACLSGIGRETDQTRLLQLIAQSLCETGSGGGMGGGQVKTYITNPNTEGITPDDPTKPGVAYSSDGSGSIYGWNISTAMWV